MGRPTLCVEMSEFADGVAESGTELQPGKARRDVVVGGPKELWSGAGGCGGCGEEENTYKRRLEHCGEL